MTTSIHYISSNELTLERISQILSQKLPIALSEEATQKIQHCQQYLAEKLKTSQEPIYGINTGFGYMCKQNIDNEQLTELQRKIVISHACGIGDDVPAEIVKIMLLLKIQSLAYGHSGVRVAVVQRLIEFYNANVLPVVFQQGSLGASGDLVPLAHLALPLLGLGEVWQDGKKQPAGQVLAQKGWQPISLIAKEGLALLNGTQFMAAYGTWCLLKAQKLLKWGNAIGTLSLEAFDGRKEPFHALIHQVRPHEGQQQVAQSICKLLEGSKLIAQPKKHVQDPYSFRCMPQVHGASYDTIAFVKRTFETEINSVTDNPNIFPEADEIISGGNFHGQPLALGLDFLAIALAELGNISERRVYQLMYAHRDLPNNLVANAGLNSGLMILQYTAASIVSQNKQLCTPASIDSIPSSSGQEDHVSMGANGAVKCFRVVENLEKLLAIELQTASQALQFRQPLETSPMLEELLSAYRKQVPFAQEDRLFHSDLMKSIQFLDDYDSNLY